MCYSRLAAAVVIALNLSSIANVGLDALLRRAASATCAGRETARQAPWLSVPVWPPGVEAACPNRCSGAGTCGAGNACTCDSGYTGGDCSLRECPTGSAVWVSKAVADDDAHTANSNVPCSNRGICDYKTGICDCFDGFTGLACDRLVCRHDCTNNGICRSIADISSTHGVDTTPGVAGDGVGPSYANWDADVSYGCECDFGWRGGDCADPVCPFGDDPRTIHQQRRGIVITTGDSGGNALVGSFRVGFAGNYATLIDADGSAMSDALCESAFEAMEAIQDVDCKQGAVDGVGGTTYTVVFTLSPFGVNNLHTRDGDAELTLWTCDKSRVTSNSGATATCAITDLDLSMAVSGVAGDTYTYKIRVEDVVSDPNAFYWSRDDGAWTGPVSMSAGVAVQLGGEGVFANFASEWGHTYRSYWTVDADTGGATITASPTYLENVECAGRGVCNATDGACHCLNGYDGLACDRLSFQSTTTDNYASMKHLNTSKSDYAGSLLYMAGGAFASSPYSDLLPADTWTMIRAVANDATVFRVSGAGDVSSTSHTITNELEAGSVSSVTSGITVTTAGLDIVAGGATIEAGGWSIPEGASFASSAATTAANTWHASSAGFDSNTPVVKLIAADSAGPDDFSILEALSGATPTLVFDVSDAGKTTAAGGFSQTGAGGAGVDIQAGGLKINTGDATVTGGTTLLVNHANDAVGVSITNTDGGFDGNLWCAPVTRTADSSWSLMHFQALGADVMRVRGDGQLNVYTGGFEVAAGGATLQAGGLQIDGGGETITAGGLAVVAGGATVTAGGLAIDDDGATVVQDAVSTAGLSITATHASFADDVLYLSVPNAGSTTNYDMIRAVEGANTLLTLDGEGTFAHNYDTIIGDTTSDTLTFTGYIAGGSPLVFEGGTVDGFQGTLAVTNPSSADITINLPDVDATHFVLNDGPAANDRVVYTASSGVLKSDDANIAFDGAALNLNGPSSATWQSSAASVAITSSSTLTATASTDVTLQATAKGVNALCTDATNGVLAMTAGNTATLTAGSTLTAATADDAASAGISITTGDGGASGVGGVTVSTGAAGYFTGAAGSITVSAGKRTDGDGGDVTIRAGLLENVAGNGGAVTINAGDSTGPGQVGLHDWIGGSVSISGGAGHASGTSTGGSVILQPGAGSGGPGSTYIQDGGGTSRITVDDAGAVAINTNNNAESWTSVGVLTVEAGGGALCDLKGAGAVTLTGSTVAIESKDAALTVQTPTNGAGTAGSVTITAGTTNHASPGAAFSVTAGESDGGVAATVGGAVAITGGEGSDTGNTGIGGTVSIVGGAGPASGGGGAISIVPGAPTAGDDGTFEVQTSAGTSVISVADDGAFEAATTTSTFSLTASGAVTLSSSGSTGTLESNGAVTLSSTAGSLTMTGKTSMTLTTDATDPADITITAGAADYVDHQGGEVIVTGGALITTANTQTAGSVSVTGGLATTGGATKIGGNVILTGGDGPGTSDGSVTLKAATDSLSQHTLQVTGPGGLDVDAVAAVDIATRDLTTSATVNLATGDASAGTTGSLTLSTGSGSTSAGAISITPGETDQTGSGDITVTAGQTDAASSSGGDVVITAGQASSTTAGIGGSVRATAGAGGVTGGSVVIIPGDGTGGGAEDGSVSVRSADGSASRLSVDKDGTIDFTAGSGALQMTTSTAVSFTASSSASVLASGDLTLTATAAGGTGSLKADTLEISTTYGTAGPVTINVGSSQTDDGEAVTIVGGKVFDDGGAPADDKTGGHVSITGGASTGWSFDPVVDSTGGSVVVIGGAAVDADPVGSQGGDVIVTPGTGATEVGATRILHASTDASLFVIDKDGAVTTSMTGSSSISTAAGDLTVSANTDLIMTAATSASIAPTAALTLTSTGTTDMSIVTDDTGAAGGITMSVGTSTTNNAPALTLAGSAHTGSNTAGDVVVTGGAATVAADTGGDVVVQAGQGDGVDGLVLIKSADKSAGTLYTARVTAAGNFETDGVADASLPSSAAVRVLTTAGVGATATVTIASGDSTNPGASSGNVELRSGEGGNGVSGAVTISAGKTDVTPGPVIVKGGEATATNSQGGNVVITSGEGATAGDVNIDGGAAGTGTGGSITLSAGNSPGTSGSITFKSGDDTARVAVGATGAVDITSAGVSGYYSTGDLTLESTGSSVALTGTAVTVTAGTTTSATMTLLAESTMTVATADVASSPAALQIFAGDSAGGGATAGVVTLSGGDTDATATAGSVTIKGGVGDDGAASATGGDVLITPGDSGGGADEDGNILLKSTANTVAGTYTLRVSDSQEFDVLGAGNVDIKTASGTTSGALSFSTGDASAGQTGAVTIETGLSGGGTGSGGLDIYMGQSTSNANPLIITGGKNVRTGAAADGGAVSIVGGTATAPADVGGAVSLVGGAAPPGTGGTVLLKPGSGSDAAKRGSVELNSADGSPVLVLHVDTDGEVTVQTDGNENIAWGGATLSLTAGDAATLSSQAATTVESSGSSVSVSAFDNTDGVEILTTGPASGARGPITVTTGQTDTGNAGTITVTGGKTTKVGGAIAGGAVNVEGGQGQNGGDVALVGGISTANADAGGVVALKGGTGSTNGKLLIESTDGTDRVEIDTDGAVNIVSNGNTAWTGNPITLDSGTGQTTVESTGGGNVMVQSTTGEVLTRAGTRMHLITDDNGAGQAAAVTIQAGGDDAAAGAVTVRGGKTTASPGVAGHARINGGENTNGGSTGGSVVVAGGEGITAAKGGNLLIRGGVGTAANGEVRLEAPGTPNTIGMKVAGDGSIEFLTETTLESTATAAGNWVMEVVAIEAGPEIGVIVDHESGTPLVHITDDGDGASDNYVRVLGTERDGELLVIFNEDDNATTGDIVCPSGEVCAFTYYSGWFRID